MLGETVAQYRIVEALGSGSMGVVYRAEDKRLERTVALKFLPPELTRDKIAKDRFLREARSASRLDHPNICTIHEIGETDDGQLYIVMAFYGGENLRDRIARGPLAIGEAVAFAVQIARGLGKAHSQDIVHRDIKPANVLLTGDGQVKILDFGLAKVMGDATLTRAGASLGTPMYMSPEQILGDVSARSDIWSLGVVLYEMLAGARPFESAYSPAVIFSIVHREPTPIEDLVPELPAALADLVSRLLVKDPAKRIASADEVLAALSEAGVTATGLRSSDSSRDVLAEASAVERPAAGSAVSGPPASRADIAETEEFPPLASATAPTTPAPSRVSRNGLAALVAVALVAVSAITAGAGWRWLRGGTEVAIPEPTARPTVPAIAVLPFDDLSEKPGQSFFADGMTEALITDLGKVSGVRVISRASAMSYKGASKPLPQIADELRVDHLLQGSVLRAESMVRINAQLIDGELDEVLWSDSYERPLRGILALQREVARAVVEQIEVRLTPQEASALSAVLEVEPDALDLYLQGRAAWSQRRTSTLRQAIELFKRALAIEPDYALAHVGLAESYQLLGNVPFNEIPPREADAVAEEHARKALAIDDSLGEAYATLAMIDCHRWQWQSCERQFRRAFELAPSYATAYQWYGENLMLLKRWEEARHAFWRAELLDPLSPVIRGQAGRLLVHQRRYAEGAEHFRHLIGGGPGFWLDYYGLATAYLGSGEVQQALEAITRALELSGGVPFVEAEAAIIRAHAGDPAPAAALLGKLAGNRSRELPPTLVAGLAVSIGDRGHALKELEHGLEMGDPTLPFIDSYAVFDPLREEPRFREILATIGLGS